MRLLITMIKESGFREAKKNLSFKQLRNSCDIGLSTVILKKIF